MIDNILVFDSLEVKSEMKMELKFYLNNEL
jgi:hypothetical protein